MMAVLWDDIAGDIASMKRHLGQAVAIHRDRMAETPDYIHAMAFQHAMQAGYTAFEAFLKRLLHLLEEPLPTGPNSHAALLSRVGRPIAGARPAILDGDMLAHAETLRRFRHVAMHSYDDFDPRRATIPVEAAAAVVTGIDVAIARFRAAVDPG